MTIADGVLKSHTKTEAQGYAPDWPALEIRFPVIVGIVSFAAKWAYIEQRCRESEADAVFVKAHRPKIRGSHRVIKDRVVTDDFCEFIVDQLITETSAFGNFKYHDSGTGVVAENATDSGLGTPCGEARDVGTQVEDSAKVYKSIATATYAGTFAITEHGLFNAAAAGILMDRTKFAAVNVVSGNQIEWTFTMSFTSGG